MTVEQYFRDQMPAIKKVITGIAWQFRLEPSDLVQEILLRAWRKREQYDDTKGVSGFMGWIWLMSYNEAINKYRVVRRHGKSLELIDEVVGHRIADRYDHRQHLASVWRSLRAEFGGRKTLIMYMYSRGYKMWEISETLNVPDGTVKNLIHQFRNHLKEQEHAE